MNIDGIVDITYESYCSYEGLYRVCDRDYIVSLVVLNFLKSYV